MLQQSGSPSEDFPFALGDESKANEDEDGEENRTPHHLHDNEDSNYVTLTVIGQHHLHTGVRSDLMLMVKHLLMMFV